MLFSYTFIFSAIIVAANAYYVVDLTPDNFDSYIGQGKPALVEFYAPWCGHCKNLAPVYEELGKAFLHAKEKVTIARVDADGEGKSLGQKYGVTGYPTLKWFDAKGDAEKYDLGRDLETLVEYVMNKIQSKPLSDIVQLAGHNFDEIVLDSSKNALVTFTANWCGHCRNLKPHYEKVATTFQPESDCVVANIVADEKENSDIRERYGITSFPTIKFFSKDNKEPEDYDGARTEEGLVAYLNKKCGTHRAVGGGVNDQAGRHVELDTLAQTFYTASSSARESLYSEALEIVTTAGSAAKYYVRVMEKIINGSAGYIEKESKRLQGIISKGNLASSKLDELKIKANILRSFVAEKEDSKEAISREEAEL
jgi:protein disulfide-isomerase A6